LTRIHTTTRTASSTNTACAIRLSMYLASIAGSQ